MKRQWKCHFQPHEANVPVLPCAVMEDWRFDVNVFLNFLWIKVFVFVSQWPREDLWHHLWDGGKRLPSVVQQSDELYHQPRCSTASTAAAFVWPHTHAHMHTLHSSTREKRVFLVEGKLEVELDVEMTAEKDSTFARWTYSHYFSSSVKRKQMWQSIAIYLCNWGNSLHWGTALNLKRDSASCHF